MHPDGYLELRDRSKDVIISGGENIASIEVEQALAEPPGGAGVRGGGGAGRSGVRSRSRVTLQAGAAATEGRS